MKHIYSLVILILYIKSIVSFNFKYNVLSKNTKFWLSMKKSGTVDKLKLHPIKEISGEITLPGSKSLTNRVLLLSALSEGTTIVRNVLESNDTSYMIQALKDLKVSVTEDKQSKTVVITGVNGPIDQTEPITLFLGNAGTAMRPLTGVLCAGKGSYILDGTPRMRERPIIDLVDGLQQLGVNITCSNTGCPPVSIQANGIIGGEAKISGQISSQYLSALLMTGPLATGETKLIITDELMSAPYVLMTINLMKKFGIPNNNIQNENNKIFITKPSKYISPKEIFIEGDASSASYFLAGAAITGGTVTVYGCGSDSIQGDARFANVLQRMGCDVKYTANSITLTRDLSKPLIGIDEDCGDIPDVAMTLAIVGIFATGQTIIRNVYNWRVKETERMVALVTELTKLGVKVVEGRDYLIVNGLKDNEKLNNNIEIETYDDHRIAMCFALAACGNISVTILDPQCTSKTFPDYFEKLALLSK